MHLETQIFPVHSSNPTFVKFSIMDKIRQRLSDLGYAIYDAPAPVGSYVQCVRTGNLLHLSGGISVNGEDKYFGKVGQDLTVEEGQAASHAKKGWEELTDAIIRHVAEQGRPTVFMLWGSHAQSKRVFIPQDRGHLVLMSNHPSPLSALRPPVPFIGNGHFGKAREFKLRHGY